MNHRDIIETMAMIGIPSVFTISLACFTMCLKFTRSLMFISSAIKSQIRNELIKDFETYQDRKWCSTIEQTEWLNRYKSYHNLYGENGVLDNKKTIMENMPNSPQAN